MILTINPNAAVDMVMFIDEFRPGTSMRPNRIVLSVGGKALDSAVVLKTLGAPVQALSFVAGENGKVLARLLEERNALQSAQPDQHSGLHGLRIRARLIR